MDQDKTTHLSPVVIHCGKAEREELLVVESRAIAMSLGRTARFDMNKVF